jgi:hypothetical protein
MCAQESDCGAQASCVAGRCVAHGANPAIDTAQRVVVSPVDVGWVSRDGGGSPSVATLGRQGAPSAAFLRFALPLPPELSVLEAYVVLERVASVDADAAGVVLHAAPVISPWDGASLSWARQPRVEEVGSPLTRVPASASPLVRIDVRDLVLRWRRRGREDLGLAILADTASTTGIAVALAPTDVAGDRDDPVLGGARQLGGPRLEAYVK